MNLEKILAENMLRFGTKNLGQSVAILNRLIEAAGDPAGAISITAEQSTILATASNTSTAFKNGLQTVKNVLVANKQNPLTVLCAAAMNGNMGGVWASMVSRRAAGNDKLILKSIDGADASSYKFTVDVPEITLTTTAAGLVSIVGYKGATNTVDEFLTYINTYNLAACFNNKNWNKGNEQYVIDKDTILNDAGQQSLTGTLNTAETNVYLYRYKGGTSLSIASKFVPQIGPFQSIPLTISGINVAANIESAASTIVNDFLKNPMLKGWTISKIINQTGVDGAQSLAKYSNNLDSFKTDTGLTDADLKVPADQSGIAGAGGTLDPAFIWPDVATQQTTSLKFKGSKGGAADSSYNHYGGLGLIAIKRAANIEAALKAIPEIANVPIQTKPWVSGTEDSKIGQYGGTIFFSVKGPNGETELTKEILAQLASQKQSNSTIERLVSDNTVLAMFSKFNEDAYELGTAGK
jgi:hypothetical protein